MARHRTGNIKWWGVNQIASVWHQIVISGKKENNQTTAQVETQLAGRGSDTYGTSTVLLLDVALLLAARAVMTFPRQLRLLLMAEPSFKRAPVAPVLEARSEPAY